MPTYERNPKELVKVAEAVLSQFDTHRPLLDAKVKLDYLFAYPRYDEMDRPIGNAITKNGIKALGICRKVNLRDRTKGHGDAEITIDGEWWKSASERERSAIVDHELHHVALAVNRHGVVKTDDLGRPVVRMRKHDFEVGWFAVIAQRHGVHSQEQKQASWAMESMGQFFWPSFVQQQGDGRFSKLEARTTTS